MMIISRFARSKLTTIYLPMNIPFLELKPADGEFREEFDAAGHRVMAF
jgi:hypothetical protein